MLKSEKVTQFIDTYIDRGLFTRGVLDELFFNNCKLINTKFFFTQFTGHISYFSSNSSFRNCNFVGTNFKRNAFFNGDSMDFVDFSTTVFNGNLEFNGCHLSDLNFKGVKFYRNVKMNTYTNEIFKGKFNFTDAEFSDSSDLTMLKIPDTLDFSNTILGKPVDLTILPNDIHNKNNKVYIRLLNTDVSKLNFDYINYKLLLYNEKGKYSFELACNIYESLLNKYKDKGSVESYKNLDIEYRIYKDDSFLKWRSSLSWLWWNFGYNREYCFYWTFGLILLFSLPNCKLIDYLNEKVYPIESIPRLYKERSTGFKKLRKIVRYKRRYKKRSTYLAFKRAFRIFYYSVMYTSSIFLRLTLKLENINFKQKWGIIYLFVMYTLGIICLAYMANFVLQK